jgi:cytochrome c553
MLMVAIRRSVLAMLVLAACADDDTGNDGQMDASTHGDGTADDGSSSGAAETSGAPSTDGTGAGDSEGSSGATGAPAVDYAGEIQPIWDAACTCHLQGPSGTMTATTLTLNADVSHAELVGTPATQADLPRVAPGDPEGSYLWHKLQGTHREVGGSGTPMPQIGTLSEEELASIEAWIAGGAAP